MPAISIMIKPASGRCNLRCKYCFYHDLTKNREIADYGIMDIDTAKRIIDSAVDLPRAIIFILLSKAENLFWRVRNTF